MDNSVCNRNESNAKSLEIRAQLTGWFYQDWAIANQDRRQCCSMFQCLDLKKRCAHTSCNDLRLEIDFGMKETILFTIFYLFFSPSRLWFNVYRILLAFNRLSCGALYLLYKIKTNDKIFNQLSIYHSCEYPSLGLLDFFFVYFRRPKRKTWMKNFNIRTGCSYANSKISAIHDYNSVVR